VFFAGGLIEPFDWSDRVDIYDIETEAWSQKSLSVPRLLPSVATAEGKVFFAGGCPAVNVVTDVVDIYDINNDEWSVENLQVARTAIAAIAYNDKIYFAGGSEQNNITSDIIEIFNVTNGEWEDPMYFENPRIVRVLKVHDALVFAGEADYYDLNSGFPGTANGIIDIYYPETDEWETIPDLSPARKLYGCASYKNMAFFAGGYSGEITYKTVSILHYDTLWTDINNTEIQEFRFNVSPNPFSSAIKIDYTLNRSGKINISLFNPTGRKKKVLLNEHQIATQHQLIIDAKELPAGIYFCVLKTNYGIQTKKIIKL